MERVRQVARSGGYDKQATPDMRPIDMNFRMATRASAQYRQA
jgi:hypothetical protein